MRSRPRHRNVSNELGTVAFTFLAVTEVAAVYTRAWTARGSGTEVPGPVPIRGSLAGRRRSVDLPATLSGSVGAGYMRRSLSGHGGQESLRAAVPKHRGLSSLEDPEAFRTVVSKLHDPSSVGGSNLSGPQCRSIAAFPVSSFQRRQA
jgi:hypothetical protein